MLRRIPVLIALLAATAAHADPPQTRTVCHVPDVGNLALDDPEECARQGGKLTTAETGERCWIDGEWVSGEACEKEALPDFLQPQQRPATWRDPQPLPADWQARCPKGWYRPDDPRYRAYRLARRHGTCMVYKYDKGAVLKQEDPQRWKTQGRRDEARAAAAKEAGRKLNLDVSGAHGAELPAFGDICRIPPSGNMECAARALTVRTDF